MATTHKRLGALQAEAVILNHLEKSAERQDRLIEAHLKLEGKLDVVAQQFLQIMKRVQDIEDHRPLREYVDGIDRDLRSQMQIVEAGLGSKLSTIEEQIDRLSKDTHRQIAEISRNNKMWVKVVALAVPLGAVMGFMVRLGLDGKLRF